MITVPAGVRVLLATKLKQAATVGGNVLVVASAEAEKGTEFVIPSTEPIGSPEFLETPHTSDPAFDAAVILLQSIIFIRTGSVRHVSAQR